MSYGRLLAAAALSLAGAVAARPSLAQDTTSSVLDGVYTLQQAEQGSTLFAQHCAACHGSSLAGVGEAPALTGGQFISDFNGLTLGDLFERIRTTMPLNDPGSLSREQYAGILAFLLKANGFPAGERELYKRTEYLNAVRFVPPEPSQPAAPSK